MLLASIIYVGVTLLLSLIDSIRIKVSYGKVGNIDHNMSTSLAVLTGGLTLMFTPHPEFGLNFITLLGIILILFGFIGIRIGLYDPILNLFRILMKTNPTMRLDYESPTTSSYVDNHSRPIGFWQKRVLSIGVWGACWFIYYSIFKSW